PGRRDRAAGDEGIDDHLDRKTSGDACGEEKAEQVAAARRRTDAQPNKGPERREQKQDADKSELLPDDGEDKVGLGEGQIAVLLHRLKEADAQPTAIAERIEGLDELIPLP